MGTINLGIFDDCKHLLRSRLLGSEFHVIDDLVKVSVGEAPVWKTFYLSLPAPDGSVSAWSVTKSMLDCWDGISVSDLERVVEENEHGSETIQRLSDIIQE